MELAYSDNIVGLNIAFDYTNARIVMFYDDLTLVCSCDFDYDPWSPSDLRDKFKEEVEKYMPNSEKFVKKQIECLEKSDFFKKYKEDYDKYLQMLGIEYEY